MSELLGMAGEDNETAQVLNCDWSCTRAEAQDEQERQAKEVQQRESQTKEQREHAVAERNQHAEAGHNQNAEAAQSAEETIGKTPEQWNLEQMKEMLQSLATRMATMELPRPPLTTADHR
jgi:hypothetical protein